MAVSVNLSKAVDKAYEDRSVAEILDAPVSALSGVSDGDAALLDQAFGIKTVRDFGSNKYFAVAGVLVALAGHESGPQDAAATQVIDVNVYLDTDEEWLAKDALAAVDRLLRSAGFTDLNFGEIVHGSFTRRGEAQFDGDKARLAAALEAIEHALILKANDLPQAEADVKTATAVATVINSLAGMSAAVQFGSLLIVKDGDNVAVKQLTPTELNTWSRYPELQTQPGSALRRLAELTANAVELPDSPEALEP